MPYVSNLVRTLTVFPVFSGAADNNVPTHLSCALIKEALENAGNSDYQIHLLPHAGHGLGLNNLPEADWPRMAYGYVQMMEGWFKEMTE